MLAAVLFALYYANWIYGWITPDDLDFYQLGTQRRSIAWARAA